MVRWINEWKYHGTTLRVDGRNERELITSEFWGVKTIPQSRLREAVAIALPLRSGRVLIFVGQYRPKICRNSNILCPPAHGF